MKRVLCLSFNLIEEDTWIKKEMFPKPFLLQLCKHKDLRTRDLNSLFSVNKRLFKIGKESIIKRERRRKYFVHRLSQIHEIRYLDEKQNEIELESFSCNKFYFSSHNIYLKEFIPKHFPRMEIVDLKFSRDKKYDLLVKARYKLGQSFNDMACAINEKFYELGFAMTPCRESFDKGIEISHLRKLFK